MGFGYVAHKLEKITNDSNGLRWKQWTIRVDFEEKTIVEKYRTNKDLNAYYVSEWDGQVLARVQDIHMFLESLGYPREDHWHSDPDGWQPHHNVCG